MVQSVSKCSGSEAPYSPIVDTGCDSPSSLPKACKTSGLSEKKSESHSVIDAKCLNKSCVSSSVPQACDFHCEADQKLNVKCAQSKKIASEDLDDRQSPNDYLWQKLEALVDQMISEEDGIPVRNVKSLMSIIPSTFTGRIRSVDKKRDKLERLVLESQERAYWDLHRPPPGCINTTDIDMRKLCRAKRPKKTTSRPINFPIPSGPDGSILFSVLDGLSLRDRIDKLHTCSRTRIKSSKAAESLQVFYDLNQEPVSALNPWISDNPDYWNTDLRPKYLPIRRIKRWSFSIHELLKDPVGLEEFQRWLEKEFSAENLRFWQACQVLKGAPLREVRQSIMNIYQQYLAPNAVEPINIDSRIADLVRRQIDGESNTTPNRYCFEAAEEHIFHLMKSDSYCRFLRSDVYRELFRGDKKKSKKQQRSSGINSNNALSSGPGVGAQVTATVNFTGIE
uniref:RGS domain-containing protein n=1 Tax=Schistosoma curassoni TaxID=6186 RepID=A0A183KBN4_9TREM